MKGLIIDNTVFHREEFLHELLVAGKELAMTLESAVSLPEAEEKLRTFQPDVLAVSYSMSFQHQDGQSFFVWLRRHARTSFVVYGLDERLELLARQAGAGAYLVQPLQPAQFPAFSRSLIAAMLRFAASSHAKRVKAARPAPKAAPAVPPAAPPSPTAVKDLPVDIDARIRALPPMKHTRLIAIGASTGGTEAIRKVLLPLTAPLPPIVIVQHIPAFFSRLFSQRLDAECALTVREARDGDVLLPNHVYIAPGEQHMRVACREDTLLVHCHPGPKVHSVCPSVDVLFASIAENRLAPETLAIILTGMGKDGAEEMKVLRDQGARTLGEDRSSCVVYGMPSAARQLGAIECELPLDKISTALLHLLGR